MAFVDLVRRAPHSLRKAPVPARVPCAEDLATTLRRERARINRAGGEFSLLTFAAPTSPNSGRALDAVAQHLARRVRIVDHFAKSGDRQLWLLLWDCSAENAVHFARNVCRQFSNEGQRITYDLYYYSADHHVLKRHSKDTSHQLRPRGGSGANSSAGPLPEHTGAGQSIESLLLRSTPLWKRFLDQLVAALGLLLLLPLFVVVAILIKLTSRGPVLFSQLRAGKSGRPFRMYKFRTMVADAEQRKTELLGLNEQDGPAFKIENDPRLTTVGRILRATCVDELPQLWNVFLGEMSLVGPRPLPVSEADGCAAWQRERLDVTPGLTCSWQVCDRRARISFAEWMRMDIRYVRNRSLKLDILLILQTLAFVVRRKGI